MNIDNRDRADELLADADRWGPEGDLGNDVDHARPASESERAAMDDALELQMISIRLQRGLLQDLKAIADHHGIGYQPMIRDLLNRFASSEIRVILEERLSELARVAHAAERPATVPVTEFLERTRKQA